jgi:ribonuclease D
MAILAATLIDHSYARMKDGFKGAESRDRRIGHDYWEYKPLSEMNLRYAAIDGWVSYELYHKLMVMQDLTKHLQPPPLMISENRNSGAGEDDER